MDPRVDDYIRKAEPFARPILEHLRRVVHRGCPDVVETIKWRFPNFEYHGLFCNMAAFKAHVTFGFWKPELVADQLPQVETRAMGQFGRIAAISDLPSEAALVRIVKTAAALKDQGIAPPRAPRSTRAGTVRVPADLKAALSGNRDAQKTFDRFSPSDKREYVEWLTGAKTDATRARRLAQAVAWMAEGKRRNWKYERPRAVRSRGR